MGDVRSAPSLIEKLPKAARVLARLPLDVVHDRSLPNFGLPAL